MKIHLLGTPLTMGGGNVEMAHTALLFRSMGWEVTFLAIERCTCGYITPLTRGNPWLDRMEAAGCGFRTVAYGDHPHWLRDGLILDFCHTHVSHLWPEWAQMGCKLIHAGCMTHTAGYEMHFTQWPPTAGVFQSEYQRTQLEPHYKAWGVKHLATIHGAMDLSLFPFAPRAHKRGEPFWIGKIARPVPSKWTTDLWEIGRLVRASGADARFLCLGWNKQVDAVCGKPPEWARCYPPDTVDSHHLLTRCHALLAANDCDIENWPRVGLEAMATGVMVVADDAGGWSEMLGVGGAYGKTKHDFAEKLRWAETHEEWRREMIANASGRVLMLCDPQVLARQWESLVTSLA